MTYRIHSAVIYFDSVLVILAQPITTTGDEALSACERIAAERPAYAAVIARKAQGLAATPTAANAYRVIDDLLTISEQSRRAA